MACITALFACSSNTFLRCAAILSIVHFGCDIKLRNIHEKKLFFILSNTMFTRQFDLPNWTVLTFTQRFVSTNKYFWSICHFVLLPLFIIFGVATAHFYGNYSNGCGWRIFFIDSKINNDLFLNVWFISKTIQESIWIFWNEMMLQDGCF